MVSPRRYVEPPPRVRVLDFATATAPDRFSPPKASIIFSPDGICAYGLQDRPAVRVLRYAADAAAAAASSAAAERAAAQPAGRRHAAFYLHLYAVRRNEARCGVQTVQARGAARSSAALYKTRLSGSQGVASCLVWHTDQLEQAAEVEEEGGEVQVTTRRSGGGGVGRCKGAVRSDLARPGTAPPSRSTATLDMWSQPMGSTSPRFKSRTGFERRRCATPDTDAIERYGYLQLHRQRRATAAAREAKEAELIAAWPHGLPKSELRRADACGLKVVGVGMGGNPLSMPLQQYRVERAGIKWY